MRSRNLRRLLAAVLLTALLLTALSGCKTAPQTASENTAADAPAANEAQKAGPSAQEDTAAAGKPAQKPSLRGKDSEAENPSEPAAQKDPPAEKKPSKKPSLRGEDTESPSQTPAPAVTPAEGAPSLTSLRERMKRGAETDIHFAAAYLGYVGGLFDEGFEKGFPQWLAQSNPRQLEANPFIAGIDQSHIIGGAGHLYCIVPRGESASLAVNRIHWDEEEQEYVFDEVVYRMESGEPILLFANLNGNASEADTTVVIVSENGQSCEWYPMLDAAGALILPWDTTGNHCALDFTEYADVGMGTLGDWLANGWLGPIALSLAGEADMGGQTWTVRAQAQDGRSAFFMLTFYPGDETGGRVDLDWSYEEQTDEYEEQWSGWWTLATEPDQPSHVTLDLTRVGGANYGTVDGSMYLSETYPVMISPSGESLLIAAGENGIPLPFMADSTLSIELMLAMG